MKKDKSNAKISEIDDSKILEFVKGLGGQPRPQSIRDIRGDLQFASLIPLVICHISDSPESKILDIGCGNGGLLVKLIENKVFENFPNIIYIGFDYLNVIMVSEIKEMLKIPNTKIIEMNDNWIDFVQDPCIIVIKNVFHEIKEISVLSKLIFDICFHLPEKSILIIQDTTTLKKAEKEYAGWFGDHLVEILNVGGIKSNFIPEESKSGIKVFTILGRRKAKCNITIFDIQKFLIDSRKRQLGILQDIHKSTPAKPENILSILRLLHDITEISGDLRKFGIGIPNEKIEKYEKFKDSIEAYEKEYYQVWRNLLIKDAKHLEIHRGNIENHKFRIFFATNGIIVFHYCTTEESFEFLIADSIVQDLIPGMTNKKLILTKESEIFDFSLYFPFPEKGKWEFLRAEITNNLTDERWSINHANLKAVRHFQQFIEQNEKHNSNVVLDQLHPR